MTGSSQKALVSIGVPTFNGEKTIRRTLLSLIGQRYTNIEIIVSDDGSTDDTCRIGEEFAHLDSRIKFFPHQNNRGAVWNFNYVLEQATGEFFFWCGQDDVRLADYVEKCIEKLSQNPKAVYCNSFYQDLIGDESKVRAVRSVSSLVAIPSKMDRFMRAYQSGIGSTAFYGIYRLNVVKPKLLWQNFIGSDNCIFNAVLLEGDIEEVPEVLFKYYGRDAVRDKFEHSRFLSPGNRKKRLFFPYLLFIKKCLGVVWRSSLTKAQKCVLASRIIGYECLNIATKLFYKLSRRIVGVSRANDLLRSMGREDLIPLNVGYKDR